MTTGVNPYRIFHTLVETHVSALYGSMVYFYMGDGRDLADQFTALSGDATSETKRFPCVLMITDVKGHREEPKNFYAEMNYHLVIATLTDKDYSVETRLSTSFEPVLMPIMDALSQAISDNKQNVFSHYHENISFDFEHKLVVGRNLLPLDPENKTTFPIYIDAIDITNLKLKLKKQNNYD